MRAVSNARLAGWFLLVALLAVANYTSRAFSGKPDRDVLYHWSTVAGGLVQYALILGVVLAISTGARDLLALRRPRSWGAALRLLPVALVTVYVVAVALDQVLHAGDEQGLTPKHWEPAHAGAYAGNFIVIACVAPFVEELAFRGLGVSLLLRWGTPVAIVVTAVAFAAAHGLVEGFAILAVFGAVLAWVRLRTDSVVPGMLMHGAFNAISLIVAVST